jgi:hypothetical protein
LAAKVRTMTGRTDNTTRQAAYDLRKIRGKQLIEKLGRSHRYHLPAEAARIITGSPGMNVGAFSRSVDLWSAFVR